MKAIFTVINCACLVVMAYFCVDLTYKKFVLAQIPPPVSMQKEKPKKNPGNLQKQPRINPLAQEMITKRNLFKVETGNNGSARNAPMDNISEKIEPTTLSLVLHGTVAGPDEAYAVIEDKKIRQQSLYITGDKVQGAEIKQILRHKVILLFQGQKQVLVMEDKPSKSPKVSHAQIRGPVFAPAVLPPEEDNSDKLSRMASSLMRQIKFRPHLTDGEPDGLIIYGIRPSSVFRKVGLRNGDIIHTVNDTPVVSSTDTKSLFVDILQQDQAKITFMRQGKLEELVYDVNESLQENEP